MSERRASGDPPTPQTLTPMARRAFAAAKIPPPAPEVLQALVLHLAELYRWNTRINLTAIRDPKVGVRRHLVESWEGVTTLQEHGVGEEGLLVDLGSGNGYPALTVLAGLPAGWRGILFESVGRKVDFLRSTIQRLGWTGRVEVRQERVLEPRQLPDADIITFRAFPKPAHWASSILEARPEARLLIWLASADAAEIGLTLERAACSVQIQPLRSHRDGALLLAAGATRG